MTRRLLDIVLLAAIAALLSILFCPMPELYGNVSFSTAIEDRNGKLLRLTLADDERYRLKVSLEDIAPQAIDATVLYEDRHFFAHYGINPGALLRAAWVTYVARSRIMGGSTITMQLARLRFGINTKTISGKLVQIARAIQLERHYTKAQILEAYLNLAPYGGNIEGIGTASLVYYGRSASKLSLPEAMALAVIPQNPARRNLSTNSGPDDALAARARLLQQWIDRYELAPEALQQFELPLAFRSLDDLPFEAPHFANLVALRTQGGGTYQTTLDLSLQHSLEAGVADHVARFRAAGINNASALLINSNTMQVLASVGSAEFFRDDIQGQVDGTVARRSPGSTLKPFVYGMALDKGLIHPMTLLKDAPTRFAAYTPENYDRGFMGPIFAKDALVYSRNVPAIDLLARVGHENFHHFLRNAQVRNLRDPDFYGLAAALGGIELSMQELVELYAMLANSGLRRPVSHLLDAGDSASPVRLLSPEASFLILDILRGNPRPNALPTASRSTAPVVAWKTGTSYGYRDAWSVGVFGQFVLAVWVGNFDGSGNPAFVGREAAAPLFFSIADAIIGSSSSDVTNSDPSPDLNLRKVDVCARTGDLPGRHCPGTTQAWFIPGVSPISVSNVHRAVRIDRSTGLRVCDFNGEDIVDEVFEFWPSDIFALLREAGIATRRPPPFARDCTIDLLATAGAAPRIRSVSDTVTYQVRSDHTNDDRLALTATTDADVDWLFWFVGDQFLGKTAANEALLWKPVAGPHRILAVDDLGRSDSVEIAVAALP